MKLWTLPTFGCARLWVKISLINLIKQIIRSQFLFLTGAVFYAFLCIAQLFVWLFKTFITVICLWLTVK